MRHQPSILTYDQLNLFLRTLSQGVGDCIRCKGVVFCYVEGIPETLRVPQTHMYTHCGQQLQPLLVNWAFGRESVLGVTAQHANLFTPSTLYAPHLPRDAGADVVLYSRLTLIGFHVAAPVTVEICELYLPVARTPDSTHGIVSSVLGSHTH
uniref:Uncharacterized protein n=1 Tax=Lygus hesperus TaxID=30085 RepID=A0A146KLH1_LYGHE